MNDQTTQQSTEDSRSPRRQEWDAWVASEQARHVGKDHEFVADREFDENDTEGHLFCSRC